MKKIILLATFILTAFCGNAQLATYAQQVVETASLTNIKAKLDTANQIGRAQATAANQVISTSSLAVLKAKLDTANQNFRKDYLQQTTIKQKGDTINQNFRKDYLQQTTIKQKGDTINQNFRKDYLQQTTIKQKLDSVNQFIRLTNTKLTAQKLTLDSMNQVGKIKVATFSMTSSNADGSAYALGDVIMTNSIGLSFSVSVGTGNYEIVSAVMYPSAQNATIAMSMAFFTSTLNPGADNATFTTTAAADAAYCGNMSLSNRLGATGLSVYETTPASTVKPPILVIPTSGLIYVVLYCTEAFAPTATATYNFKLFLRKLK